MKAHPYSFLTFVLITLTFLFLGPALADNIDATLPDSNNTSSFQVKNSESSNNVLMKVQSGGYVGIGTPSPAAKLDIFGELYIGTTGTPGSIRFRRCLENKRTISMLLHK